MLHRVGPYLRSRATRLIKSPKMYTGDSGLACFLTGVAASEVPADLPLFSALFETSVALNLLGIVDAAWPTASLHFWDVQGRYEVDFIIEAGRHCLALEVKSGGRWEDRDLSGLRAFHSHTTLQSRVLSHNGTEAVQLGEKLGPCQRISFSRESRWYRGKKLPFNLRGEGNIYGVPRRPQRLFLGRPRQR